MSEVFVPAVALMLVTAAVWLMLFVRRLVEINARKISPQALLTPEKTAALLSERAQAPNNCLKNLFELPVIFYALTCFVAILGKADQLFMIMAWLFVAFRAAQAIVHCTYNTVQHRFFAYLAGSLVLWAMLVRFALDVI